MKKLLYFTIITLFVVTSLLSGCSKKAEDDFQPSHDVKEEKDSVEAFATAAPQPADGTTNQYSKESEMSDEMLLEPPALYSSPIDDSEVYQKEEYGEFIESAFNSPLENPLSTFSIDVDTASYSNIRRYLTDGYMPPEDAVRIEECINYFSYDYPQPEGRHPLDAYITISTCPWNEDRYLARVAVQGEYIEKEDAGASNLVFSSRNSTLVLAKSNCVFT